jgi:hypothetical protein
MAKEQKDPNAFSYFLNSDRIAEVQEKLDSTNILTVLMNARKADTEATLYLVAECFKSIRAGFLFNEEFNGNQEAFLNLFLKKLLKLSKKDTGPFWTVDILESNKKDQLEQMGIEFYSYAKLLTYNSEDDEEVYSDEQETNPILEEKGLFAHLSSVRPEYAQILSYMAHYTPSDEICKEMGIAGLHTLRSKIKALQTLVDAYFNKDDRRDDELQLAK